jgi:type III secretion protein V
LLGHIEAMNIDKLQSILRVITQRSDIVLALYLITIILMMVLPLPTAMVDMLVAINMSVGIILLMMSVYIPTPLAFSSFPAVLLLTTLFRLALSISTTRLILLEADAGSIITTFGNLVVGGNIVVGIVVFMIITVVQFIVITKGSERVAEVGARFSLDAMPGKQMSIDGDMRAGVIDAHEARRKREILAQSSQFYGSMDGAMKFVKGDAVAGIFIIIINIVGGISIGTMQEGMAFGDAAELYSILTVGDGLVSQIPALFISITAGIIVTRVNGEESGNLGEDIGNQILAQPKALMIGAGVMTLFALIPGFPTATFLALALLTGGVGFTLLTLEKNGLQGGDAFSLALAQAQKDGIAAHMSTPEMSGAEALMLNLSPSFSATLKKEELITSYMQMRQQIFRELGVPFPGLKIGFYQELSEGAYSIDVNGVPISKGEVKVDHVLVTGSTHPLDKVGIKYIKSGVHMAGVSTLWVASDSQTRLEEAGIRFYSGAEILIYHLSRVLRYNAEEFLGTQETSRLLNQLKPNNVDLLNEMQSIVVLKTVVEILKNLVAEGVSIRDIRNICEALLRYGQDYKDAPTLTAFARVALSRQISHTFSDTDKVISVIMLDPSVEVKARDLVEGKSKILFEPEEKNEINQQIEKVLAKEADQGTNPVIIVPQFMRTTIKGSIKEKFPTLPVLAYQELTSETTIKPLHRVTLAENKPLSHKRGHLGVVS